MTEQTVREARKKLEKNFRDETQTCPCCDQLVKLYKRKLNTKMAKCLIDLYKLPNSDTKYYHTSCLESYDGGGDFAKLRYWKLIREMSNSDKSKRSSGFWKITATGQLFVENKSRVASHILMYNQEFYGYTDTQIDIYDGLADKFDYEELMKDIPNASV